MNMNFQCELQKIRAFYEGGRTLEYDFRIKQLEALDHSINKHEEKIFQALKSDLGKSKEEAWVTETGMVSSEIRNMIRHLKKWMKPEKVGTPLVAFPSISMIYKEPLGVVLIIAPWNYPFQLLLTPLAGAIAGGNCVVLKPSELAPATENILCEIIKETFDENYLRIITGDGASVIPAMTDAFRFDHIFYTGSTSVGKRIYQLAASTLTPVTLELGGKSPCIIYPDADLDVAAKRIVLGKFLNAGQTCIAPDYLLAEESIAENLMEKMKLYIHNFYSNDASASQDYGRIINDLHFKRLRSYLDNASIYFGEEMNEDDLYIAPTILTDVKESDSVMQEEIFGPILPVLTFSSTKEAMIIVEQHRHPLSLYLFTNQKSIQDEWIKKVSFGGGCINNTALHFTNKKLPFGGVGNSGIGSYHGKTSFDLFTHKKPVLKTGTWFDPSIKYPPFKGKMKWFKRLM
jgi:aldehyde dehydrogenase (NAD+)